MHGATNSPLAKQQSFVAIIFPEQAPSSLVGATNFFCFPIKEIHDRAKGIHQQKLARPENIDFPDCKP